MQVQFLGDFAIYDDAGQSVPLGKRMVPLLLARLLLSPNDTVTTDQLLHDLWDNKPPAGGIDTLRRLVSRTRSRLQEYSLDIGPYPNAQGYRIIIDLESIDSYCFENLIQQGTTALATGNPHNALSSFNQAAALWRTPPLGGITAEFAERAARRLEKLHSELVENLLAARAQSGEITTLLPEIKAFCQTHPTSERVHLLYFRLLATMGERAEALRRYEQLRRRLAAELGTDPSPQLQELHAELLKEKPNVFHPTPTKTYLTSFYGRETELETISKLFRNSRLVSILGPGGIGKTRLAVEYLHRLEDQRSFFFDLAPLSPSDNILSAVCSMLGLMEQLDQYGFVELLPRLAAFLSTTPTTLVLDNCEHLLDAVARFCLDLFAECPSLTILTTSREPITITGEALLRIAPLPTDSLAGPASQMFKDLAALANPNSDLDDATALTIAARLEGIPLAIELTATRMRNMSATEIAQHLEHNFHIVTHTKPQRDPRHSTLETVLDWTWSLLTPQEQSLAMRLSVLTGGISLESAAALAEDTQTKVLDLVHSLADKSLIHYDATTTNRWQFLETTRFYLAQKLRHDPELAKTVQLTAAQYFARLGRTCFRQMLGIDQFSAQHTLQIEANNFIATLRFAHDYGYHELGAKLTLHISWYWALYWHFNEIKQWLVDTNWQGIQSHLHEIFTTYRHALFTASSTEAQTLSSLNHELLSFHPPLILIRTKIHAYNNNLHQLYADIKIAQSHPHPWIQAAAEAAFSLYCSIQGDLAQTQYHANRALQAFTNVGDQHNAAAMSILLADIHSIMGEHEKAISTYHSAISSKQQIRHSSMLLDSIWLGEKFLRAGDIKSAKNQFRSALKENDSLGFPFIPLLCHTGLSVAALAESNMIAARKHLDLAWEALITPFPDEIQQYRILYIQEIRLSLAHNDLSQAKHYLYELLQYQDLTGFNSIIPDIFDIAAFISHADKQPATAARFLGTAAKLRGHFDLGDFKLHQMRNQLIHELGEATFNQNYTASELVPDNPDIAEILNIL